MYSNNISNDWISIVEIRLINNNKLTWNVLKRQSKTRFIIFVYGSSEFLVLKTSFNFLIIIIVTTIWFQ